MDARRKVGFVTGAAEQCNKSLPTLKLNKAVMSTIAWFQNASSLRSMPDVSVHSSARTATRAAVLALTRWS
jgi:hypothetical protein